MVNYVNEKQQNHDRCLSRIIGNRSSFYSV